MFFSRRKRAAELAAREAAGESFWTTEFSEAFRVRLLDAFQRAGRDSDVRELLELAQRRLTVDLGRPHLSKGRAGSQLADIDQYISAECPDHEMPDLIDVLWAASRAMFYPPSVPYGPGPSIEPWEEFAAAIRDLLFEERLAYDFVQGRVIERQAEAMHRGVVLPTLTLLAERKGFDGAEKAYRKALEELASGDPADAITDAVRAVQETMDALGWEGNTVAKKFDWARSHGKMAGHDTRLIGAFDAAIDWANADRSERGDAHRETELGRPDAQLTVNIAGALILRLVELA